MSDRDKYVGIILEVSNRIALDAPADDPLAPMLRIIADAEAAGAVGELYGLMRSWYEEPGRVLDTFGGAFHLPPVKAD